MCAFSEVCVFSEAVVCLLCSGVYLVHVQGLL